MISTRHKKNEIKHDLLLKLTDGTSNDIIRLTKDLMDYMNPKRKLIIDGRNLVSQTQTGYENIIKSLRRKCKIKFNMDFISKELLKQQLLVYNNAKNVSEPVVYAIERCLNFTRRLIDLTPTSTVEHINFWITLCGGIRNLVMGVLGFNTQTFCRSVVETILYQPDLRSFIQQINNIPDVDEIVSILHALESISSNDSLKTKMNWILTCDHYEIQRERRRLIFNFLKNFRLPDCS